MSFLTNGRLVPEFWAGTVDKTFQELVNVEVVVFERYWVVAGFVAKASGTPLVKE